MTEIQGNLLRGHLDTLVLSVLKQAEAHGFEVLRRLEERGAGALRLKEGTLYPVLYRLEDAGLIAGKWEDGQRARRGPRRRVYRITSRGSRELARRRQHWQHFVSVIGGIVNA
jgi:DNA-binding PadR family transcriptional regulator